MTITYGEMSSGPTAGGFFRIAGDATPETPGANRAMRRRTGRRRRAGMVVVVDAALALGFAAAGMGASAPTAGATSTTSPWVPSLAPLPGGGTTADGQIVRIDCTYAGRCIAVGVAQNATGNTYGLIDSLFDSTWTSTTAPLPAGVTSKAVYLDDVSCASADSCMVVGSYMNASTTLEPMADVWNGSTWSSLAVPLVLTSTGLSFEGFGGLACQTSGDCTAVVDYKQPVTFGLVGDQIASFSGGTWTEVKAPVPVGTLDTYLNGLSCQPDGGCVVVGGYDFARPPSPDAFETGLVDTGSGTSWSMVATPVPVTPTATQATSYFTKVSCVATSCTAVGGDEVVKSAVTTSQLLTGTLAHGAWSGAIAPLPSGASTGEGGSLESISCVATGWCLATGEVNATDAEVPVASTRSASGAWSSTLVPTPPALATAPATSIAADSLSGVSCVSPGECSAVGEATSSKVTGARPLLVTLSGTTWTSSVGPLPPGASSPETAEVAAVQCVPSECIAGGAVKLTGGNISPLFETNYQSSGYDLVGSDGGVFVLNPPNESNKGFYGSLPGLNVIPNKPVVGMVPTLTDEGYFLVASDGGVFSFGNAPFLGSLPGLNVTPNQPIAGLVAADTDNGYFLVGKDGGVYAFGTVPFLGSLPGDGISVNNIVGIAATPSGSGYWLVSSTGTVYGFGAAKSLGNTAKGTSSPVSAIAGTPTGGGYWITTQNGTVYPFGNAAEHGTLPALGVKPNLPVIGIVRVAATVGYWLIGADGGIFAFGTAPFVGSLPGLIPPVHVTNIVGAVPN